MKIKITTTVRYFQKNSHINQLKINLKIFCSQYNSVEIWREKKVTKETFYAAKKPVKIWDVNVDNIVISKLIETKIISKYLIGYLDKARPLVFIMPKTS